jgi:hypothetical protein
MPDDVRWTPIALLLRQGREFGMTVAAGIKALRESMSRVPSNDATSFLFRLPRRKRRDTR